MAWFSDGLINFVARLGTGADKSAHDTYNPKIIHDQAEIDTAYRTTWFRKIVDIPAEDAIREGVAWQAADDQIERIEAECNRLGLWPKLVELLKLARKDGSAGLFMGGLPGDAAMPINPRAVGLGSLRYLTLFERHELRPGPRDDDVLSPTFNQPKHYTVGTQQIHPSRIIRRLGNKVYGPYWDGEGDSLWQVLRRGVIDSDRIAAATATLVHEAKNDVAKLKGFMDLIRTSEYENTLMKRMQAVKTMQSLVNLTVIDGEDDYQSKTYGFNGLPDIQDRALMIMCGLADIPATRLLGRSPQGMNSTGESDLKNYYDQIMARQKLDIGPSIHPLLDFTIASALGSRPPEVYYEWNPLWQMTEKEAAEVEKSFADGLTARANTGMFDDRVLAKVELNRMTESGQYPGIEAAIAESTEDDGVKDPDEQEALEIERMTLAAQRRPIAANDATPRTLYVRRDVINSSEISKWAKSQGLSDIVTDMHVTIVYSQAPIDWIKAGNASEWGDKNGRVEIAAGGPRAVEPLGNMAAVLMFASSQLCWRHEEIIRAGASHGFPDYQPHISLTKSPADLSKVEPYRGAIVLGPEIFEEVKP